jgi:4,5-dihydroxyphthalate decarboxylase
MSNRYPQTGPVTLRTNLADSALATALKQGKVSSPIVRFDFCGPPVASNGFKAMVRERAFDAGELAIVTFMQAKSYGKPLTLLPATVVGRFQHSTMSCMASGPVSTPRDLEGRRVAVRAYTQTTGVWARGILQHEYGVDLAKITWMTTDDPHLAEFTDPPNAVRVDKREKPLDQRIIDGEADAGILGPDAPKHPDALRLIADHAEAAVGWHAKYGCTHINHMFVVDSELAETRADAVAEIYRMLAESKAAAGLPKAGSLDTLPFGFANVQRSLEIASQYANEQGVIPRRFTGAELFDHGTHLLGR